MTREEALKIWLPVIKTGVESMQEFNEALDMAIKALEREPCNDVLAKIRVEIDRQEKWLMDAGYTAYNVDIAFSAIKSAVAEGSGEE